MFPTSVGRYITYRLAIGIQSVLRYCLNGEPSTRNRTWTQPIESGDPRICTGWNSYGIMNTCVIARCSSLSLWIPGRCRNTQRDVTRKAGVNIKESCEFCIGFNRCTLSAHPTLRFHRRAQREQSPLCIYNGLPGNKYILYSIYQLI